MSLSDLLGVVTSNGALGLALALIVALAGAVVHLYRARERDQEAHTAWMLRYTERQLESDAKLTAALVGVKEAIELAISARGTR